MRTTRKTVTFAHPFRLGGVDGVQLPGTYPVDTDEEPIDNSTRLAWRRVATTITVERDGAAQVYRIDPVDLEASLLRDGGSTVLPPKRNTAG
jgi:hypothetical protein